ncbi:hypothetical protein Goarm_006902, partial [Gossypium armourianum]|nr:hypothetical protein [Gossypium armourianum]
SHHHQRQRKSESKKPKQSFRKLA